MVDGKPVTLSKVASVKSVGVKHVYDLEVANHHNYYANGVNVHNCDYHAMLTEQAARTGEDLFKFKDTFLLYKHRRLFIYPAGPDKRILRGRTRVFGSIDELGWFDNEANSKKIKTSAEEVYTAIENSLATVRGEAEALLKRGFNDVPTGYFFNISSPSSVRDKITELVKHAQGSDVIFGLNKATWEMNPKLPFKSKVIQGYFKKNPVNAMRDFGAQPPLTSNPFIGSSDVVSNCIVGKRNPISITYATKKAKDKTITRYAYINKLKKSGKPCVLALDAGHVNNSFACCVARLQDPDAEEKKVVIIDLLVEIQPLPGMRLNYSRIYEEIILPIIDDRNVQLLGADRWQSIKILSDAEEDAAIQTKTYSVKYADLQQFKSYMEDEQVVLPQLESDSVEEVLKYDHNSYPNCFKTRPVDHFVLQCLTVQDTGSQVLKGDNLTDDLFRASALATSLLLDPENAALWKTPEKEKLVRVDITKCAYVKGLSNSGGSASMPTASNTSISSLGFIKGLK
jgi:hypothetical protein